MPDPLLTLAQLPGVADDVAAAREACERLRWHPAMRRRSAEVRAEACVWAARASAAVEGARLPVTLVRDAVRGARDLPGDPAGQVVAGATRAVAEAERLSGGGARAVLSAPRAALVRLHVAAVGGSVDEGRVGRPRVDGEDARGGPGTGAVRPPDAAAARARLDGLVELLAAPTSAPALVLAAVASAEIVCAAPFPDGNGIVARALQRALVVGLGLDPMGAVVPESALLADPGAYLAALEGYATGTPDGLAGWLRFTARSVVTGAEEGATLADAVLAGRLPRG